MMKQESPYYAPTYKFYGDTKNINFYMGVELEVNAKDGKKDYVGNFLSEMEDNNFIYFKHDCSIGNGVEIVSHPATFLYHINTDVWKNIFENINKYELTNGSNCGLHFHLSKSFFSPENIMVLDYFINSRDKIVKLLEKIGGRKLSGFCARIEKPMSDWGRKDCGKFSAFHFKHQNTVELRFCDTTSKIDLFFKRMELIYFIALFIKKYSFEEIVKSSTDVIYNDFIDFILNNNSLFLKKKDIGIGWFR